MKIDYRALAEKLNALSERLVDSEEHAVEAAIPPIAEEAAEALCTLVSLLKGMADQEPIAWMYEHDGCMDTPIITIKRWAKCEEPWNESPLVPHPAPQPQSEPTEAQSTIAERRLRHALDGLDHGIVANDVREVLDELAVLRATLATKETK